MLGLVIALAGFIVALNNFGPLGGDFATDSVKAHGTLGIVVMCIGLQQPLNAIVRPHKGDTPTAKRRSPSQTLASSSYLRRPTARSRRASPSSPRRGASTSRFAVHRVRRGVTGRTYVSVNIHVNPGRDQRVPITSRLGVKDSKF